MGGIDIVIAKHVQMATVSPSISTTAPNNYENMYAMNNNRTKQGHHILASLTSVTDIVNGCTERGHNGTGSVVGIEGLSDDGVTIPRDDDEVDDDIDDDD